eukprot:snap_masked-scaffold_8-processed-gene-13.44-mRNA-1 protein AED:1.00 eAED:1.00 QI:0/-1/0/0/-1/1/1/0/101
MDTKSTKTAELNLQPQSQTLPNDEWIVLRGSAHENIFEVFNTVAAKRFRWKRTASHRFVEEETKKIFDFNSRMTRRCNVKCLSSPTCTFELNIRFDLSLAK